MHYLNPYSLLGIEPGSSDDSAKSIRSAKKRVLADIELDGTIQVDEIDVGKSEALRAIDELEDEEKCRFHSLIFCNEDFRKFLTCGNELYSSEGIPQACQSDKRLMEFIEPYYAEQFDKVLANVVATGDFHWMEVLWTSAFPPQGKYRERAFQSARKHFSIKLEELREKLETLEYEKTLKLILPPGVKLNESPQVFNPLNRPQRIAPLNDFENYLLESSDLEILNLLPDEFQHLKDNFASTLRNLAITVNNDLGESDISLFILDLASRIFSSARITGQIEDDYELITENLRRRDLSLLNEQLKDLAKDIRGRKLPDGTAARRRAEIIFDPISINRVSSQKFDPAIVYAAKSVSQIAWLINTSYLSSDHAIELIDRCLKLRLSDQAVSKALLKRMIEVRFEIEQSRETIHLLGRGRNSHPIVRKKENKSEHTGSTDSNQTNKSTGRANPVKSGSDTRSVKSNMFSQSPKGNDERNQFFFQIGKKWRESFFSEPIVWRGILAIILSFAVYVYFFEINKNDKENPEKILTSSTISITPPEGMVVIPGGTLSMGRRDGSESEKPVHEITVYPFYIDIYETTNEQYAEFVKATKYRMPSGWLNGTYRNGQSKFPVVGVNWDDAKAYAKWRGKRLPTEEEWEYAAKGQTNYLYPWGVTWMTGMANADNQKNGLVEAGQFKGISRSGLYDLVGNAWEWTDSDFKSYPNGKLPDVYKSKMNLKTIRGGAFDSTKDFSTVTYRIGWPATGADDYSRTGFRCAMDFQR